MTDLKKKRNKQQLQELVLGLSWNDRFGCYTRRGFELLIWPDIAEDAEWIIFLDIDEMHALNEQHGYDSVDVMIKKSLAVRATDYVASQWQSGDEFLICLTRNKARRVASAPIALCDRLKEAFAENGCSATFGIVAVASKDLTENVRPAADLVRAEKTANRRGKVNQVK